MIGRLNGHSCCREPERIFASVGFREAAWTCDATMQKNKAVMIERIECSATLRELKREMEREREREGEGERERERCSDSYG